MTESQAKLQNCRTCMYTLEHCFNILVQVIVSDPFSVFCSFTKTIFLFLGLIRTRFGQTAESVGNQTF